MKNVARACLFGSLVVVAMVAMLAACEDGKFVGPWPLAPSGGSIPDAAGNGSGSGGGLVDGETTTTDGGPNSTTDAEGGTSGDAGDGGAVVLPYPSVTIAAGIGFGCHIDGQGDVWCWGNNNFGQAGSTPSDPVALQQVMGVTNAKAIALGDYHACAVTTTNAVLCWGLNNSYQLGHPLSQDVSCPGAGNQPIACNATPSVVSQLSAVAIAAAGAWTCTVGVDGSVSCWGAVQAVTGDGGPCGNGTAPSGGTCNAVPYPVSGVSGVTQLAVAFDHACALVSGDAVMCWGNNDEDQVTHGYCPNFDCSPVTQGLLPAATSVAVGTSFSCALVSDGGTVSCFGDNVYGELGHAPGTMGDPSPDAGETYNYAPQTVVGLGAVNELVASGSEAACVIVGGGTVECWGNIASDAGAGVPVAISGLPPMVALGVPDSTYACGVGRDGAIWCWSLASGAAPIQVQ